jgi:hypothetical protein
MQSSSTEWDAIIRILLIEDNADLGYGSARAVPDLCGIRNAASPPLSPHKLQGKRDLA